MIFRPMKCANFIGNIYWHMSRYTALGKNEETKRFFFAKTPFWFRTLGIIFAVLYAVHLVVRIKELL